MLTSKRRRETGESRDGQLCPWKRRREIDGGSAVEAWKVDERRVRLRHSGMNLKSELVLPEQE